MARLSNAAVLTEATGTATTHSMAQELVSRLTSVLPVDAVAVTTVNGDELHVEASSGDRIRSLALIEARAGLGPCRQAMRTGIPVTQDLSIAAKRWPQFAQRATQFGYRSVCAVPLRLHEKRLGAVILARAGSGPMAASEVAVGQALADLAAIGIVQQRKLTRYETVNLQLQTALDTRIVIEQAKGILAERDSIDVSEAFDLLRSHARRTRQPLAVLAHAVVTGADTKAILSRPAPVSPADGSPADGVTARVG